MRPNMTVQQLAEEVTRQQKLKQDFVALCSHGFHMTDDSRKLSVRDIDEFEIRDHAHTQLAEITGIPLPYYRKMQQDAPGLVAVNVNRWLAEREERQLIRTLGGQARAVLSSKYRPLDNDQLIEAVMPALYDHPGIQVRECNITESRMYLKAVLPRLEFEVRKGDIVQFGLSIANSEIGSGALEVAIFALRLICLNGMTVDDGKKRRNHIGGRIEGDGEYLADETRRANDKAFFLTIRDTVKHMLTEAAMENAANSMRKAAGEPIRERPDQAVKKLAKQLNLTDGEGADVLSFLMQGGDMTRWGMANAITRSAQDVEDYDRAMELERLGGKVLTLAPNEWEHVAIAA